MGAINYGSNEIINLGIDVSKEDDFGILGEEVCYIYDDIKNILDDYYFYYYHVVIKEGYYSGFYLDIESNIYIYDDYIEKKEAQKELTKLKKFLHSCVDNGLVVYTPGWCTGYYNLKESKDLINKAIAKERENIKDRPTWGQYVKEGF
jgi:hypothetical protein